MAVPVAGDPFLSPRAWDMARPSDPAIFDRVVIVDMSVTFCAQRNINQGMAGKLIQHMIKESHACVVGIASAAIKIDGDANFSLVCGSVNARCAHGTFHLCSFQALYMRACSEVQVPSAQDNR